MRQRRSFGEQELIRMIERLASSPILSSSKKTGGVIKGIGDDCAVLRLPAGRELLATTDFSLEGTHFRRGWHPPESVGNRCLARGLSDIAAMGGDPLAAFLSLALPRDVPRKWVNGFMRGFIAVASRYSIRLAGGDTSESPAVGSSSKALILADVTLLGSVPRGQAVLRSGARAGDNIFVTGTLGSSAATLAAIREHSRRLQRGKYPRDFFTQHSLKQYFFPQPRIKQGRYLRERGPATAMIDISDGLSTDLEHICAASGVGAVVAAGSLPRDTDVSLDLALHGGEDYELLFTASPSSAIPKRVHGVAITQIGKIVSRKGLWLEERGKRSVLRPRGWQHFNNR